MLSTSGDDDIEVEKEVEDEVLEEVELNNFSVSPLTFRILVPSFFVKVDKRMTSVITSIAANLISDALDNPKVILSSNWQRPHNIVCPVVRVRRAN